MKEGNNYDAVFAELADAALSATRGNRYIYFISNVHRKVLDPLLRQGTSEGVVSNLKARAREIFNTKKHQCGARDDDAGMIRYTEVNTVPRANGTRR